MQTNVKPCTSGTRDGHGTRYYMEEGPTRKELESVQEERDLGVTITADLKSSSQWIKSVEQQGG